MMKLLRKYNKPILAVGTALLMIVFIGGSALQGMLTPDYSGQVVAKCLYGDITRADQQVTNNTTDLLASLGLSWRRPVQGTVQDLNEVDWNLLVREAKASRVEPSIEAAKAWVGGQPVVEFTIQTIARGRGVKPDRIYAAIAEFLAVRRAALAVAASAVPSEAEIRRLAAEILDKVRVRAVRLPARVFEPESPQFSEQELTDQFEEFRDTARGRGLEFGYFIEPSVKVQYVKIDRDKIAEHLRISDKMLEREARKFYDANRDTYAAFKREAPPEEGATEGAEPLPDERLSWEEAKEIAVAKVRTERADAAAKRIADWLVDQAAEPWFQAERRKDGYQDAAERVGRLEYYEDLVASIRPEYAYPEAVTVVTTDFLGINEAALTPEIGTGQFANQLRRVEGIAEIPRDGTGDNGRYLSRFETAPTPVNRFGNYYVYRVVDVRDAHPADTLDEVRDQVIADLTTLRGFEAARAHADRLATAAAGASLREAFDADAELAAVKAESDLGFQIVFAEPEPFSVQDERMAGFGIRLPRSIQGIGQIDQEVIEEFFSLADADDHVRVFELRQDRTVLVVEWVETIRGTEDEFEALRTTLAQQLEQARTSGALREWLDPQQIRIRCQLAAAE